jgi:hypothetical protein
MLVGAVISKFRIITELFQIIAAILTNAAGINQTTHTDAISGFKFAYLATHFGHFSNNFMAGHHGKSCVTPLIAHLMTIGVTNPAEENFNLDIGW